MTVMNGKINLEVKHDVSFFYRNFNFVIQCLLRLQLLFKVFYTFYKYFPLTALLNVTF